MNLPTQDSLRGLRTGDATRRPAIEISTPHQRLYIRTLMQQLELDTRYVTLFHMRFFDNAGVPYESGAHVDAVLCALPKIAASRLIAELKKEVPRD